MANAARKPLQACRALPAVVALTILALAPWVARTGMAQTVPAAPVTTAPVVKPAVPAVPAASKQAFTRPAWQELTPMQQQSLKPLAASWNRLSEQQKRKWLQISNNYASLSPAEQANLHGRMNEWVSLSPQQRAQARLNFGKTRELSKELTPEQKKAQWQTYQALSPEEKQKLAAKASPKPAGAATAVKPVSPQKLAAVPPHRPPKAGSTPADPANKPAPASPGSSPVPAPGPSDVAGKTLSVNPPNTDTSPGALR